MYDRIRLGYNRRALVAFTMEHRLVLVLLTVSTAMHAATDSVFEAALMALWALWGLVHQFRSDFYMWALDTYQDRLDEAVSYAREQAESEAEDES